MKKIKKNIKCKEKIIKGALEVFVEKGFGETSIASIVKHSGISNGAMYHHFSSKEELIKEVFWSIHEDLTSYMLESLKDCKDIREKLYAIWSEGIKWSLANPKKNKFKGMFSNSPYMEKIWAESTMDQFKFIYNIFDEATKSEIIIDMDIDYLMCYMKSSSDGVTLYLKVHPEKYSDDFLKDTFKIFWRSIVNF